MKPIIIKVDKDDNVTMKLSEFKKYMDDAYQQGKADGEGTYWWRYSGPSFAGTPVTTKTVKITCDGTTTGATISAKNINAGSTSATVFNPDTPSTNTI